jgi:hypothetical protein
MQSVNRETKFKEDKDIGCNKGRNGLYGTVRSIEVVYRIFEMLGIMSLT